MLQNEAIYLFIEQFTFQFFQTELLSILKML